MNNTMNITLKIWRQKDTKSRGKFITYKMENISPECSFLEMLDQLNEKLIIENQDSVAFDKCPVTFDHDCREGICGMCGLYINGRPHGPGKGITTCQLHMRSFKDGDTIVVEPWRAKAFPVMNDLVVDRTALDMIIQAGGYISMNTGGAPDANSIPVSKHNSDLSMDAAACIGCGACVASCKNASVMLFAAAKVSHLALLPQGKVEAKERVQKMVAEMDKLGFGNCTNTYACEIECPKEVSVSNIARMNREYLSAKFFYENEKKRIGG
ncbi:MAG: succinate dehydrogenase/fumarate reductase iron-sulfur subunit [Bacteroidales bacterium]|nr:succinate dehydrogenase/fumarate reductase iron-sulfur subunit [Bacteroidales bacterium]